ncbi:MAG: TMEM165/GDT1 family protein [Actinomycetota bacterium]|nr:TMEM165/GDT1 family protein [Actinomycetota bacterium]
MDGLVPAFAVVALAELGDKSQLIALSLATRGRPLAVLAGIAMGAGVVHAASVTVGTALRAALPTRGLGLAAGVVFLAFAAATLLWSQPDPASTRLPRARSLVVTAALGFVLAELGDKTMLATVALASSGGTVGTWAGATAGTVVADAVAVVVGHRLGRRLPTRVVRLVAAASFAVVGVVVLVGSTTSDG